VDESVIQLLERVWGDLEALCSDLDEARWKLPTDCPGWSVQDQIAHVIGTERSLLGEQPPEADAGAADVPWVRNPVGAWVERWVAPRRALTGADLLMELRTVVARREDALRTMAPEDFDRVIPTPIGDRVCRDFLAIRAFDCWVHEQDIRRALGRPGDLDGALAEHALAHCLAAMPYVVARKAAAPDGTTVVFDVVGAGGRRCTVGVDRGRGRVLTEEPTAATVTLTTDLDTFCRLACGRTESGRALDDGLVRVAGDPGLARRILDEMNFMI
jgi:uncharacterized protein (TIGR03083 family)